MSLSGLGVTAHGDRRLIVQALRSYVHHTQSAGPWTLESWQDLATHAATLLELSQQTMAEDHYHYVQHLVMQIGDDVLLDRVRARIQDIAKQQHTCRTCLETFVSDASCSGSRSS